jgi:hypothetical protein
MTFGISFLSIHIYGAVTALGRSPRRANSHRFWVLADRLLSTHPRALNRTGCMPRLGQSPKFTL